MEQKTNKWIIFFRVLFTVFAVMTVVFIFYNSSQIGELSGNRSQQVTEWLNHFFSKMGLQFVLTGYQVRKLAHLSEYMLLGFWLMFVLRVYTKKILSHITVPLFLGLLIPVIDESIQLFTPGRSGQVKDIVIDFTGVVLGICVATIFLLIIRMITVLWSNRKDAQL
jgi:VanZ family protein